MCPRCLPFDGLAYLASELTQHFVAVALLNNALDPAIEARAVLFGQVFRGDDHDRDVLPVRP